MLILIFTHHNLFCIPNSSFVSFLDFPTWIKRKWLRHRYSHTHTHIHTQTHIHPVINSNKGAFSCMEIVIIWCINLSLYIALSRQIFGKMDKFFALFTARRKKWGRKRQLIFYTRTERIWNVAHSNLPLNACTIKDKGIVSCYQRHHFYLERDTTE